MASDLFSYFFLVFDLFFVYYSTVQEIVFLWILFMRTAAIHIDSAAAVLPSELFFVHDKKTVRSRFGLRGTFALGLKKPRRYSSCLRDDTRL